ncbi:hypothetical protein SAMN04487916_10270 [Arthrobacter sp. ov407]|nr:hypothetical protein SAMN04487916_10270 [Arthrobacter sp. ov407]
MFEYDERMNNASEPAFLNPEFPGRDSKGLDPTGPEPTGPERNSARPGRRADGSESAAGVLKAMSPGVVDFLFRRLVAGEPAEDVQWDKEGAALAVQPPGAELARRLAETDLDALTPTELFHYVRAAQRLAVWAEALRETAVGRYCSASSAPSGESGGA